MAKLAFVRTKIESTVFAADQPGNGQLNGTMLEQMKILPKAGSSSKNIIMGLKEKEFITECEEWKFWDGPCKEISQSGQIGAKLFAIEEDLTSTSLAGYIEKTGQPELLWVEGRDFPPYLRQIFALCPDSFKIVYSKDWRPWKIKKLGLYDLCLVDEHWEADKVRTRYPNIHCEVWDKLVDYEGAFYPTDTGKVFDICCVAYMRRRKNHELLFRAMAKLKERKLTCVCIGDDRKGYRQELEQLVDDLGLSVKFTGEIPRTEVNAYINQSRIGVLCAKLDAAPRAILEYMAADVPVLVNSELLAGSRYVGEQAGLVKSPEEFHLGLAELLDQRDSYSPRSFYLRQYSRERVMNKFVGFLGEIFS